MELFTKLSSVVECGSDGLPTCQFMLVRDRSEPDGSCVIHHLLRLWLRATGTTRHSERMAAHC